MMDKKRTLLVTNALPYANGDIHLGHLLGYIQADIWVRFQRLKGHTAYYVCGSDAHGTPIMIKAQEKGIAPEEMVAAVREEHQKDFAAFDVGFDNFYTTHSPENREFSGKIYLALKARGDILEETILQAFDPVKEMFLPDRFVKGECPKCHAQDQYGDNCEVCGTTYDPLELINPRSVLSGATPIQKESVHLFFALPHYENALKSWLRNQGLQEEIVNKMQEWFESGLRNWDISRDAPYFGFEIPGEKNKYFYVWLDAPIGYIASFKDYCNRHPEINFDEFWDKNSPHELHHFIGKDIVYFHSLFWPAMLMGADLRTPTGIYANGFVTVNGQKMSKSRGTFITAKQYLEHLPAEYLRYYFAAKLNSHVEDTDINFQDFMQRINSDLVGKIINIASRTAGFITKKFEGKLSNDLGNKALFEEFVKAGDNIAEYYETREYSRAIREISLLADKANEYIATNQPWALAKVEGKEQEVQEICTLSLNLFKLIVTYLKPVLPNLAKNVEDFLQCDALQWNNLNKPLLNHTIAPFQPLMLRIEENHIAPFLSKD